MRFLSNHHLAVAAILFAIATVLYAIGAHYEAIAMLVLGGFFEIAALYASRANAPRKSSPDGKS